MRTPSRIDHRQKVSVIGALVMAYLAVLMTSGCAKTPPNTTPQAQVAHYGTEIVQGVNTIRAAVIAATDATPPVLTVDKATPIMDNLRKAQEAAAQLSPALKAYDIATSGPERQTLGAKIAGLLNAISAAVATAGTGDLPPNLLAQTTQLIANVATTINSLRAAAKLQQ